MNNMKTVFLNSWNNIFQKEGVGKFYFMIFCSSLLVFFSMTAVEAKGDIGIVLAIQNALQDFGYTFLFLWSIANLALTFIISRLNRFQINLVDYFNYQLKLFTCNALAIWFLGFFGQTVAAWFMANINNEQSMAMLTAAVFVLAVALKTRMYMAYHAGYNHQVADTQTHAVHSGAKDELDQVRNPQTSLNS